MKTEQKRYGIEQFVSERQKNLPRENDMKSKP